MYSGACRMCELISTQPSPLVDAVGLDAWDSINAGPGSSNTDADADDGDAGAPPCELSSQASPSSGVSVDAATLEP